ncbi:SRPBCC family protein [Streptomyces sp. NPDC046925]|uniref:SRPBCC family protein n=1 Tax=Streptomyces sp. NPDC046925 TaxID=3155375 RepID=UPI0033E3AEAE
MQRTVRAEGPASVDAVWQRYVRTSAWSSWAPQIRAVEAERELREGMRGRVRPVAGPSVAFVVEAVDHQAHTWQWRVRMGPVRLRLWHAVLPRDPSGTITELRIDGPAPLVMAYAPVARRALQRLVGHG